MKSAYIISILVMGVVSACQTATCPKLQAPMAPGASAALAQEVQALTPAPGLPSWNNGPLKQRLLDFVRDVTTEEHPSFVPVAKRIAVFDNDGCLWSEKPVYF